MCIHLINSIFLVVQFTFGYMQFLLFNALNLYTGIILHCKVLSLKHVHILTVRHYSHVMVVQVLNISFYKQTVLQDVPDYAQRRRLLEGLKNRLEALLSPKIVAAFNNHSLGKDCYVLYCTMQVFSTVRPHRVSFSQKMFIIEFCQFLTLAELQHGVFELSVVLTAFFYTYG